MTRMNRWVFVAVLAAFVGVALVIGGVGIGAAEEKKEDAEKRGPDTPGRLPGEKPENRKVQQQLDTTMVTAQFQDQPLAETLDFLQTLAKVNIILDRKKVEGEPKVTLKVTGLPMAAVLKLVTEQVGLRYVVRDGVVFISDHEGVKEPPVWAVYDVVDLLKPRASAPKEADEALCDLVDLIKQTIEPGTWDEGSGNALRGINGTLVVTHEPRVHREVQEFLAEMRRVRAGDEKKARD